MPAFDLLARVLMVCLCLCIVMQVLGAPNTLWDTTMVEDAPEASIIMAVSLPSRGLHLGCRDASGQWTDCSSMLSERLSDSALFRPPCV